MANATLQSECHFSSFGLKRERKENSIDRRNEGGCVQLGSGSCVESTTQLAILAAFSLGMVTFTSQNPLITNNIVLNNNP